MDNVLVFDLSVYNGGKTDEHSRGRSKIKINDY